MTSTKFFFCFLFVASLFTQSCNRRSKEDELRDELNAEKRRYKKLDSLQKVEMQKMMQEAYSKRDSEEVMGEGMLTAVLPPDETLKEPKEILSDTTFYYFTGGKKVSAYITQWNGQRKRSVRVLGWNGKIAFEQQDERQSYSRTSTFKEFHPNGAVKKLSVHFNPGASMYMYETTYFFDTDNEPQWKVESTSPADLDDVEKKFYWDKNSKQWKQQEIVREMPVPHN